MSDFTTAFNAQMLAIHAVNTGNGFVTDDGSFMEKFEEECAEVGVAMVEHTAQIPNAQTATMNLTVELADVVIAIMFYCAGNNLPLADAIEAKNAYNSKRGYKHGKG